MMEASALDFKQLNYFVTVYKTANFTSAASQLHISQQGLSKSIQNLEQELGCPLFLRVHNRLQPTSFGDLFYTQALHLTKEFQNTLTILNNAKKKASPLRIGFSASILDSLNHIEASIWHWNQLHPEALIEISNETDYVCEEKVAKGDLDAAFSIGPISIPGLQTHFLMEESIYVLLPIHHPLSSKEVLYLSDLCEEPLITPDIKNKGYSSLKRAFEKKGYLPHIAFSSSNPQTHFRFVEKNMGISLCPEHWLSFLNDTVHLKAIMLADSEKRKIYLIYNKCSSANSFIKRFLKESVF